MVLMAALTSGVETPDFGRRGGGYSCCGYSPMFCGGWGYGCAPTWGFGGCGCYGGNILIVTYVCTPLVAQDQDETTDGAQRTATEKAQLDELLKAQAGNADVQKQIQEYYDNPGVSNAEWTDFYQKQKGTSPEKEQRTAEDQANLDKILKKYKDDPKTQKEIKAYYENPNVSNKEWRSFYKKLQDMKETPDEEAARPGRATILVCLPQDAKLTFDEELTTSTSSSRLFESPIILPGKDHVYTVTAKFLENGKLITVTKDVNVQAGRKSIVTFSASEPKTVAKK
jgi:uncharacterized protein (TIGR03000 family)